MEEGTHGKINSIRNIEIELKTCIRIKIYIIEQVFIKDLLNKKGD